ncbi:MAG: two-component system response regulator [Zetaproteobacteria bacterium]|nr:two-component system response regulator [Pseudobdellovibrionaceae bacterium]|tara:strand:+ start:67 stop:477 length:411 start_codon:yes stop_codon:yes gene_type:complete
MIENCAILFGIYDHMKVLLVDDSSNVRMLIGKLLKKKGAEVIEAENGAQGLEQLIKNRDVNLIICDVNMPVMDGITMVERYSENVKEGAPNIPIAMLTTEREKDLVLRAKKCGVIVWIIKPATEKSINALYEKVNA